ncbi:MAG: hypothetical protein JW940_20245 [Polyangiaceae bacterium]|nr:hypothetical protein [Polyangiaceae bacterium]
MRGVTIGPIESTLHPGRGYGSDACVRTLHEVARLGANWVSITPFGRTYDLAPTGIDLSFEAPFAQNRLAVARAVEQAHAEGLRVLLVPHLWVETGQWRGEIDPGSDAGWARWAKAYRTFALSWARVARDARVDMLAVGVELRSWVTTGYAPLFVEIIRAVRDVYPGPLTYAANWDDADKTVIWAEVDAIGINAFYPLADTENARPDQLDQGARRVIRRMRKLVADWHKPILFNEFGYTTRKDPALRPWEWPEHMSHVVVDQQAQADAYQALLNVLVNEPGFAGLFVWRLYADPDDVSQEAEWGFSPRGKLAELVLRDAFATHWAADGPRPVGSALDSVRAVRVGDY